MCRICQNASRKNIFIWFRMLWFVDAKPHVLNDDMILNNYILNNNIENFGRISNNKASNKYR